MKKGILNALITAILFATLEPVSKLIATDMNPYAITFWRFLIGTVLLLPFGIHSYKKEKVRLKGKDCLSMIFLGALFIAVSMTLLQVAVKAAPSPSLIAILFSSNAVISIVFARIILKEKLTPIKSLAILLCTVGVTVLVDFNASADIYSVVLALLSALSFSLYSVLSGKLMKGIPGILKTTGVFLSGTIILFILLFILKADLSFTLDKNGTFLLLYIGIFVTGLGYINYFKAIEKGGAIMGSVAFFIKPVLTPFVTFLINGIIPDVKTFASLILIVMGAYLTTYKRRSENEKN
ncbi:MAG: DMT family transporter [Clostridia bacterium]|nr:DMT family transporter [Clostridia bacterium]